MERDMDLARIILLTLAESDKPIDAGDPIFKGYPRSLVGYHFQILNEACLIVANVHGADNNPYYFATASRLTWEGNDFLDAIRDESIWKKVCSAIGKASTSASFDVFKSVASALALEAIKSSI